MNQPYQLTKIKNALSDSESDKLYKSIDKLQDDNREWGKADILLKCEPYLEFLTNVTGKRRNVIEIFIQDYRNDMTFRRAFTPALKTLSKMANAGDLRFHSLTLYVITRALEPEQVIETGVAQGKSSSMLLLALLKNGGGALTSIDLPNPEGKQLQDGSFTTTGQREVGWMVPEYLRPHWKLILGDSRKELPKVVRNLIHIDIFFHDSLHTYEHVKFEIETVCEKMKTGLLIIDNLETEAGKYFEEFVAARSAKGFAFSNLGIIQL